MVKHAVCGMVFCEEENSELLKNKTLALQSMYDMFGIKNVQQLDDNMIFVTLDNNTAKLNPFNVVSVKLVTAKQ